jgi:ferredoxin-NADP reductase
MPQREETKMFKDVKKFLQTMKAVKYRNLAAAKPSKFDGFERLHNRLHPKQQLLKIVKIQSISPSVTLIRGVSARKDRLLAPFRAGQYVGVKVSINGVITGRAYSIVSSPNNLAYYEIAVKNLGNEGFVSQFLCTQLKLGDNLEVTEPLGQFYYNPIFHGQELVFIAGGCGVTPFISLLRNIYEKDLDFKIIFIYGCLNGKEILFREEIEQMAKEKPNITFIPILSEPEAGWKGETGFITSDILKKYAGVLLKKMIYIVGPEAMRDFLIPELAKFKVPSNRILWEVAPPASDITQYLGWPSELSSKNKVKCTVNWYFKGKSMSKTIEVSSTEPLLNSIEHAKLEGVRVKNACRAGECAFCRTQLLEGNIYCPPHVKIREGDKILGYIHPCVSYPIEDISIELYIE